jgi:hypothetical protein
MFSTKSVLGPIAVFIDPAAIHRVLIENSTNYRHERIYRRNLLSESL